MVLKPWFCIQNGLFETWQRSQQEIQEKQQEEAATKIQVPFAKGGCCGSSRRRFLSVLALAGQDPQGLIMMLHDSLLGLEVTAQHNDPPDPMARSKSNHCDVQLLGAHNC